MEIQSTLSIINKLSEMSGIPKYKYLKVDNLQDLRDKKGLKYPSHNIMVVDNNGLKHLYMPYPGKRFDLCGIIASYFIVKLPLRIQDFGYPINFVKKTKICEGGGWYSEGSIYEVQGMYYEF